MRWLHRFRIHLVSGTYTSAQQHVGAIDHALANLRAEVAALPGQERAVRAPDVQALIAEQACARKVLSDKLEERQER